MDTENKHEKGLRGSSRWASDMLLRRDPTLSSAQVDAMWGTIHRGRPVPFHQTLLGKIMVFAIGVAAVLAGVGVAHRSGAQSTRHSSMSAGDDRTKTSAPMEQPSTTIADGNSRDAATDQLPGDATVVVNQDAGTVIPSRRNDVYRVQRYSVSRPRQVSLLPSEQYYREPFYGMSQQVWRHLYMTLRPEVARCIESLGPGQIVVVELWFLGSTGAVSQFRLQGRLEGTPIGSCIEEAARRLTVPSFPGAYWHTTFGFPFGSVSD